MLDWLEHLPPPCQLTLPPYLVPYLSDNFYYMYDYEGQRIVRKQHPQLDLVQFLNAPATHPRFQLAAFAQNNSDSAAKFDDREP